MVEASCGTFAPKYLLILQEFLPASWAKSWLKHKQEKLDLPLGSTIPNPVSNILEISARCGIPSAMKKYASALASTSISSAKMCMEAGKRATHKAAFEITTFALRSVMPFDNQSRL